MVPLPAAACDELRIVLTAQKEYRQIQQLSRNLPVRRPAGTPTAASAASPILPAIY